MAVAAREVRRLAFPAAERPPRSLWYDAWRRLRRNRAALAGITVILVFTLAAALADVLAPYDPNRAHGGFGSLPPAWMAGGDWRFPLGTDFLGRDIFSRLIYGARISLAVGFVPLAIVVVVGGFVGLVSGYLGGQVDNLLMRLVDVIYAFPDFLFLIILVASFRQTALGQAISGLLLMFVGLALVSWVGMARLVRGQVLQLKEQEFIVAARCVGASPARIMWWHIVPNTLAPVIVAAAFAVPGSIIAEAILSYLGVGIIPPQASWGSMILDGHQSIWSLPHLLLAPSVSLALLVMAFTFLGDGLRDALDPRMK